MHLVARSVLLLLDGERAPTRHAAVIGRFGQIARDAMSARDALMQAGRDLNRMYKQRVAADYDIDELTSAEWGPWVCGAGSPLPRDLCRRLR